MQPVYSCNANIEVRIGYMQIMGDHCRYSDAMSFATRTVFLWQVTLEGASTLNSNAVT